MPVDPADVATVRSMADKLPASDLDSLSSIASVIAYTIMVARAEHRDELHDVELLIRATDLNRDERRKAQGELRRLGYRAVADMLRTFKK